MAPRSQQLITLGGERTFRPGSRAQAEVAWSRLDRNTFSSLDEADDQGVGLFLKGLHELPTGGRDTTLKVVLNGSLETFTKDFRFIERYRAVEFERNWNALTVVQDGDQVLADAGVGLRGRSIGAIGYGVETFHIRDRYDGVRQVINSDLHVGPWDLVGTASLLTASGTGQSNFLRHKGRVQRRLKPFTLGFQSEHELNRFRSDTSDALLTGSYQFHEWEAYIQSPDTFRNKWRLFTGQRFDEGVREGALARSTLATSYGASLTLAKDPRNRLATTFTYRRLEVLDSLLTTQRPEDTYLARVDYDVTALKGVVVWDLFYEFGSGLEQRREFIYVEVPAGQGIYVWIDYNDNGIKELNEFEVAAFGYEANYVRVFVPGNTFVRTFSNQFSTSLDIRPAVAWSDKEGLRRFVGKFSDMASFRIDRKSGEGTDLLEALDPLGLDPLDSNLTAYNSSVRNTLYYDRTSRAWSVDHTYQNDQGKTLLLNGFESRARERNQVRLRVNATRRWTVDVEGEQERTSVRSDLLEGRNYSIDAQAVRPRVTWQPNTSFRAAMLYKYTEKANDAELGGEEALLQDLGLELRYNAPGKGSVQMTASVVEIDFNGEVNSSLGNDMLAGLKPGTNVTWNLTLQRNLSQHLQVDITYNGRRSEGVPTVHVGGAQVRAYF